jgi:hypothetical protein
MTLLGDGSVFACRTYRSPGPGKSRGERQWRWMKSKSFVEAYLNDTGFALPSRRCNSGKIDQELMKTGIF